jgi:hypothetical protein
LQVAPVPDFESAFAIRAVLPLGDNAFHALLARKAEELNAGSLDVICEQQNGWLVPHNFAQQLLTLNPGPDRMSSPPSQSTSNTGSPRRRSRNWVVGFVTRIPLS